ncbi:MAG TPA: DUF3558 family protein [Amycolatopsis sp.]|uniref:DUF3558 family protein n=1 Tax=Amycolatopsis sp. TaxID=37632 RepID=UPI002B47CED8|nr:DUF3558 family protein [Amycolatopsis sp.]HKS49546.1 DUF3558 family protein [Amycolatopsis sp.]
MVARAVVALAAGSLLAGCGTQAAPPAVPPAPASPSVTPTPARTGLAALEPCALLSTVDRSTAGLGSPGRDKTIGADRACDWSEPGVFGVTVTLDEQKALSALQVSDGRKLTVGRHQAVKDASTGNGTCAVLLGAGEHASVQVDVTNNGFTDTALACRRATTVAQLIEPKLP